MRASVIDTALDYARRGWAVFPCRNKIPITPHGYKDAVKDIEQVKKIFQQHPNSNIAVATGSVSGIFVLDIDVKNGSAGAPS